MQDWIRKELDIIKEKLRKDFKVVTDCFFENYMSLNPTKFHYMCLVRNKENDTFNFDNESLNNSKEEVILSLTIDNQLSFDNQPCKEKLQKSKSKDLCIIKSIKLFRLKTKRNYF